MPAPHPAVVSTRSTRAAEVSRRRWRASSTRRPASCHREAAVSTSSTTGVRLARLLKPPPTPSRLRGPWPRQARPPVCGWRASSITADPPAARAVVVSTGSTTGVRLACFLNHRRPASCPALSWSRQARAPVFGWRASSTSADPQPAPGLAVVSTGSTTEVRLPRFLDHRRPETRPQGRGLDKLDQRGVRPRQARPPRLRPRRSRVSGTR